MKYEETLIYRAIDYLENLNDRSSIYGGIAIAGMIGGLVTVLFALGYQLRHTREEHEQRAAQHYYSIMEKADQDGDGLTTLEEQAAYFEQKGLKVFTTLETSSGHRFHDLDLPKPDGMHTDNLVRITNQRPITNAYKTLERIAAAQD